MHGTSILAYNDILEEKERRPSYVGSITDSNLTLKSGDLLFTKVSEILNLMTIEIVH